MSGHFLTLLILSLLQQICSAAESGLGSFTCTPEYCLTTAGKCQERSCNDFNTTKILHPVTACDCCEYCIQNKEKDASCDIIVYKPSVTSVCGPRLACQLKPGTTDEHTCQEAKTDCIKDLDAYFEHVANGLVGVATVKPECDAEGEYSPKRCPYGLTCYCVDKTNKRIFGEVASSDPLSLTMNCDCARDYVKAQGLGVLEKGFQRCLANGNYDPLQCIGDLCFCIDKDYNIEDGPLPRQSVNLLDCFDEDKYPLNEFNFDENNFHDCELEVMRAQEEELKYTIQNRTVLGLHKPNCQPDGFYHKIQEKHGERFCVNQLGQKLTPAGHVVTEGGDLACAPDKWTGGEDYHCNCARTANILMSVSASSPVCCSNGNYRKWQCQAGKCYCVNYNGEQIAINGIGDVEESNLFLLKCYTSDILSACW